MTYFMPHILEFFGSISKTFTSPEQRRFWIPTTCWFNKCFKIRQKRRIFINTFFTTSTRNTYFIIRRRLPIFKFIATLFNCIFRNTRCTRNYADAAFANAKELQEYNFKYFVTDIAFDDYLGKWNYRSIPKVKTRSYFLAIPKYNEECRLSVLMKARPYTSIKAGESVSFNQICDIVKVEPPVLDNRPVAY